MTLVCARTAGAGDRMIPIGHGSDSQTVFSSSVRMPSLTLEPETRTYRVDIPQ